MKETDHSKKEDKRKGFSYNDYMFLGAIIVICVLILLVLLYILWFYPKLFAALVAVLLFIYVVLPGLGFIGLKVYEKVKG